MQPGPWRPTPNCLGVQAGPATRHAPVEEDAPHAGVLLQQRAKHAAHAAANVGHHSIRVL